MSLRESRPWLRCTWLFWLALAAPPSTGEPPERLDASQARIEEILTRLEKRSNGLQDIRCKIIFVEQDKINLTERTKWGDILFQVTEPNPRFLIHFAKTAADGILGKQEWYLFDGRWLYQAVERIEQVTKQEMVRPGGKVDFFDLESAPFPLPFGQKKDEILRNFDVTILSSGPNDPKDTDHLVCIPKPKSRLHDKYDKLEFYVHRTVNLPTRVIVTRNGGLEIIRTDFPDLSEQSINAGVKSKHFRKPSAWKDYKVVVEELGPEG